MAIAEDASQPIPVHPTGTTATTASFTPPAGSLIVALVAADGTGTVATTATLSDSLGGTWKLLKRQNTIINPSLGGTAEVWCRDSPGAALTVTANGWSQPAGNLTVRVLTGAAVSASQTGATGGNGGASIAPTVAVTATVIGSHVYGAILDYTTNASMTANAATTRIDQFQDATNGDTWATWKGSADTTALSSTTYGFTNANAAYNIAAAEILPAAGGGTPTAAESGRGVVGLATSATAVHVGRSTGNAAVGLAGTATAKKVVALGGACAMGLTATGTARKVAVETGLATVGLAGTGTAAKKTTQAGLAALGLTGTRSGVAARQVAGTATLGLIGSGTARKVAVERGTVALGLAGASTAAKRAAQAGLTPLGLTATRSGLVARQQSGTAAIGLVGYAANRKTVRQAGATAFGLAARAGQAKRAPAAGTATFGLTAASATGGAPIPARGTPTLTSATATVELVAGSTARLVPRSEVTLR